MSTPQKRYDDNFKYIDSFGNELPWGGFLEAGCLLCHNNKYLNNSACRDIIYSITDTLYYENNR